MSNFEFVSASGLVQLHSPSGGSRPPPDLCRPPACEHFRPEAVQTPVAVRPTTPHPNTKAGGRQSSEPNRPTLRLPPTPSVSRRTMMANTKAQVER